MYNQTTIFVFQRCRWPICRRQTFRAPDTRAHTRTENFELRDKLRRTLRGALGRYEAIRRDPTEDSPARADPGRDDNHWSGHQRGRWACIGVAPSAWPRRRRRAVPEALLARVARGNKTASPASIQPARKQRTVHTRGAHARLSGRMHGRHQQRQQSPARERLRLLIVVAGAERAAAGPVEAGMP